MSTMQFRDTTLAIYAPTIYDYFKGDSATAGGAERQLHLLSESLANRFDLHYVVHDFGQKESECHNGITLQRAHRPHVADNPFVRIKQIRDIYRAFKRADPDIILCRGGLRPPTICYAIATRMGCKFIYNMANDKDITVSYNSSSLITKLLYQRMIEGSHNILAQTDVQAGILESRFDVSSTVVPNGYPPAERIQDGLGSYYLWVGRLEKDQKQPHRYLDIASEMSNQQFRIVGPHSQDSRYSEQLMERINLLDNVVYEGAVPPNKIHQYYDEAIALVNTSKYEGFPNTFLEAWRKSVPVLSLHVDPNRFLPDEESLGFADGCLKTLTLLCNRYVEEPRIREREGEIGYTHFEKYYRIEQVARAFQRAITNEINTEV